jgi:hypothetical protein
MLRTIDILANILASNVKQRYRRAEADEAPYAIDDLEAIARANDFKDCPHSERDAAMSLAAIMLESKEGVASHWVPRADALTLEAEDDIETLAEITARKAIVGYEPVPSDIVKDCDRSGSMCESGELAQVTLTREAFASNASHWHTFASDEVYWQVFDRACELLNELGQNIESLWWPDQEPELPFDAEPPVTIVSAERGERPSQGPADKHVNLAMSYGRPDNVSPKDPEQNNPT